MAMFNSYVKFLVIQVTLVLVIAGGNHSESREGSIEEILFLCDTIPSGYDSHGIDGP